MRRGMTGMDWCRDLLVMVTAAASGSYGGRTDAVMAAADQGAAGFGISVLPVG